MIQPLSNEDFQAGGLYPGGTGRIEDFRYKLWDYNGKQPPNSNVAVYMRMKPTDGSNGGEDVEQYWNVGSANDYMPDHTGGFLLPVVKPGQEARAKMSDGCNWHQAFEAFRNNCGLEQGRFSGANGIKVMIGSEVTLTRVDQKEREFGDRGANAPANAPGQSGQQQRKFKPSILVPTRCRFAWEIQGGARPAAAVAQMAAAPATATAPAVAHVNGSGGDPALVKAIGELLAANPNGILIGDLTRLVTERLTLNGVVGKSRAVMMRAVKDPEAVGVLAAANGWTFEEGTLFV